jgi:hypothetical protein
MHAGAGGMPASSGTENSWRCVTANSWRCVTANSWRCLPANSQTALRPVYLQHLWSAWLWLQWLWLQCSAAGPSQPQCTQV